MNSRVFTIFLPAGLACLFVLPAAGALIPVTAITNNSGMSATVASQVQVDVTDAGGGLVDITVRNKGDSFSDFVITQFYIDDEVPPLLADYDTLPANWGTPGTPPNLPSGGNVSFFADYNSDADNPQTKNGIDLGESATFTMTLANDIDYLTLLDAMYAETTRIGLHIQSIGPGGQSDSFVTVPEPGSLALIGFAGAIIVRRRRYEANQFSASVDKPSCRQGQAG